MQEQKISKSNNNDVESIKETESIKEIDTHEHILTLKQPIEFEGKIINQIDMRNLVNENVTILKKAFNLLLKKGVDTYPPEATEEFVCVIANIVTGFPLEFFEKMLIKDIRKLKKIVSSILYAEDTDEDTEDDSYKDDAEEDDNDKSDMNIILYKPIEHNGQEIKEIDLSNLETTTAITLQKINNIYRKRNYYQYEKERRLQYALVTAEVLTGLEKNIFNKLSMPDAIKIRNRVTSFFYIEE